MSIQQVYRFNLIKLENKNNTLPVLYRECIFSAFFLHLVHHSCKLIRIITKFKPIVYLNEDVAERFSLFKLLLIGSVKSSKYDFLYKDVEKYSSLLAYLLKKCYNIIESNWKLFVSIVFL